MKSPDQDLQTTSPKTPGNIGGSRKLVGLNTDKRDDCPASGALIGPDDPVDRYFLYRVVEDFDSHFKFVAKNLATIQILSETMETGKRIVRQDAAPMADYVPLVIVFGGFNQDNGKALAGDSPG